MKKFIVLGLFALLAMPQAAEAAVVAGWDTWSDVGGKTYNATVTTFATGLAAGTQTDVGGVFTNWSSAGNLNGASADGTWGSLSTAPTPTTSTTGSTSAVGFLNESEGYVDFTITADIGATIEFESFNFDSYRRFTDSADTYTLSVQSGPITNGAVAGGSGALDTGGVMSDASPNDFDISLLTLADRTLLGGESAVFRLEFTGSAAGSSGGQNALIDNVAVMGSVVAVPEPSSLALLGIAGVCGLVRRRRK